jgi:hypothetical protein
MPAAQWHRGVADDGRARRPRHSYPAKYVRNLDEVRTYLRETARPIFLSRRPTPSGIIGGIVPRVKGTIKTADPPGGPYNMSVEGNVETPLSVQLKAAAGIKVDASELDAFYALHGFTVHSDVVVSATISGTGPRMEYYDVEFKSWTCKALDKYHWNPKLHITVPNPDFGSSDKGAVAPGNKNITIYHSNAIRVETAGLAKPFDDESEAWVENDLSVMGPITFKF